MCKWQHFLQVNKTRPSAAAWFVSNCHTPGRREEVVAALRSSGALEVDIFGSCGDKYGLMPKNVTIWYICKFDKVTIGYCNSNAVGKWQNCHNKWRKYPSIWDYRLPLAYSDTFSLSQHCHSMRGGLYLCMLNLSLYQIVTLSDKHSTSVSELGSAPEVPERAIAGTRWSETTFSIWPLRTPFAPTTSRRSFSTRWEEIWYPLCLASSIIICIYCDWSNKLCLKLH